MGVGSITSAHPHWPGAQSWPHPIGPGEGAGLGAQEEEVGTLSTFPRAGSRPGKNLAVMVETWGLQCSACT